MTPRENLLRLMRRQGGHERAPVMFSLCPALEEIRTSRPGGERPAHEQFEFPGRGVSGPKLPPRVVDWHKFYPQPLRNLAGIDSTWGIAHEKGSEAACHMTHMRHPLEPFDSVEQVLAYPWPDFAHADTSHIRGQAEAIKAQGFSAEGYMACTVWETAWYLRGMETLMADMMDDSPMATTILDQVTDRACLQIASYARAGVDYVFIGDDIGMQSTFMMSPALYREWLKPRLKRVIDAARKEKPDIIIDYHSCGYVLPGIPDLIEVGVDVLNPVQPECMDFAEIHRQFGDKLSFRGTIGTQTTMPHGTPAEVKRVVWRNLEIAGSRGGLWCTPTHMLEPEVPWENVLAYVEACGEFRGA
ncbi:MAG: uroporphyrinogen decarboxylase family protein [bacterium]